MTIIDYAHYRDRLYAGYHTTHVAHRKGTDTAETLRVRGLIWDATLGPLFPPDRRVRILDGACGNGSLVAWLTSRGYRDVSGVDISAQVIEVGRSLGIAGIAVGDFVQTLGAEPEGYDVIVLRDVLEHFDKAQVLDVLDVTRAALRPRGRLLLHVPNADSPFFGRVRYGDFTHETAFTASSLNQVLSSTGFGRVDFHPSNPVGVSARSRARVGVWHATAAVYKALVFAETGIRPPVVTQNIIALAHVDGADPGSAPA